MRREFYGNYITCENPRNELFMLFSTDFISLIKSYPFRFLTEFSLPTMEKPIPEAAVRVTFYLQKVNPMDNTIDVKYIFDNSSLVHTLKRTIRPEMMEKWIDRHLEEKTVSRQIMFLGTEFEKTRINDPRIK